MVPNVGPEVCSRVHLADLSCRKLLIHLSSFPWTPISYLKLVMTRIDWYDLHVQHGFREKCSCETQQVSLIGDLASKSRHGKQTYLILLDFSKAFDKVNRSNLRLWQFKRQKLTAPY